MNPNTKPTARAQRRNPTCAAPRSTPVHSSRLPIKQAWGSSIVQGGWKWRSSMADRSHFIGKRLSPAMGDDVPNLMDAN